MVAVATRQAFDCLNCLADSRLAGCNRHKAEVHMGDSRPCGRLREDILLDTLR